MSGIIYHAFDTTNGKAYVGQTWGTLEKRRKEHSGKTSNCRVFRAALRKRSGAFVWTVLTTDLQTQSDLDDAETYWGEFFDTLVPNGYNLKLGGAHGKWSKEARLRQSVARIGVPRGPSPLKGTTLPEAHKKKISAAKTGLAFTDEHRKNISRARKGKPLSDEHKRSLGDAFRGRTHSDEVKKKMSEARKRYWERKRSS